jgi:hypothetical protein
VLGVASQLSSLFDQVLAHLDGLRPHNHLGEYLMKEGHTNEYLFMYNHKKIKILFCDNRCTCS